MKGILLLGAIGVATVMALTPDGTTRSSDSSPVSAPEPLSCTNAQVLATVRKITAGLKWPFGGGPVQVLKMYDYRGNPEFGKPEEPWRDTKHPCKVNLLTDRGEFGFTYGWKVIDGETFILGQLGDSDP